MSVRRGNPWRRAARCDGAPLGESPALAPVAAAAARTAVIPARAGIVHAEVGAAHVGVTEAGIAGFGRGYDAATAAAAVEEVMSQLFAGNHPGADGKPGGQSARDAGADSAAAHGCGTVAAGAISPGCAAAHSGAPRSGVLHVGITPTKDHKQDG